jgi:alpha-galactosidase
VKRRSLLRLVRLVPAFGLFSSYDAAALDSTVVRGQGLQVEFDARMQTRIVATLGGQEVALGPFARSETLQTDVREYGDCALERVADEALVDAFGPGRRVSVSGRCGPVRKTVSVDVYDAHARWALVSVRYTNEGAAPLVLKSWTNNAYAFEAPARSREPAFWSYQTGSYENRPDWVLPLRKGFAQDNFQGMNASDYGGGTPVLDVWRRDIGLAVGHLALVPKSVSLPVTRSKKNGEVRLGVTSKTTTTLAPGGSFETLRTFVAVHRGDHFETLADYRRLMVKQGFVMPEAGPDAFRPIWCAWGYGRGFTTTQVEATLPIARRLGFGWAVIDDGWQVAEGDWVPVPSKFPGGDADMKALVDRIHAAGLRAQLWWAPLAADPGSRTYREHPDWLLRNANGTPRDVTWWDAHYLCPAHAAVRDDARAFAVKALRDWGFDGLKIDGQHLNGAPPCHNALHDHASPEDSVEGVPGFFKAIWDAALEARPDAVVEICPCGTAYSFFTMPFLNMAVASDPESSWQVRLKGKTIKALLGNRVAYFGDHVEMTDGGADFASTFGLGGVIGTNFAWPGAPGNKDKALLLTPAREKTWAFWTKLYDDKRLFEGEYLGGLYDIGFDRPEAHAVRKGDAMYYAFYAAKHSGEVELRGLGTGTYRVVDYVAGRELGRVSGPTGRLHASFKKALLLEARPVEAAASRTRAGLADQNWTHRVRIGGYGLEGRKPADIVRDATTSHVFGIEVDNDVTGRYESLLDPEEKLAAIRDLAQEAHASGNRAFIYIAGTECITRNAHSTPHSLAKDHPDWLQRKLDGEAASFTSGAAFWIAEGDEDVWISPYATAWRELYMTRVRQIAATGIDGIYVDVPYWMTHFDGWEDSWASFDGYTVEAFRLRTGLDARRDLKLGDFADPHFRKWIDFRIDTITEFVREIDRNAKSVNPRIMTIPEIYPGIEREAVVVGADVYELYGVADAIAHEYEFGGGDHMATSRTLLDWFRYQAGMHSFRAFAQGKATWILNYSWDGDANIAPPEPMMNLAMSLVMAGANFWDAATHVMSGSNDRPTRKRIFEWIERHEKTLYAPREPIHPLGVYFSPSTRNYFPDAFLRSYQGTLILLLQRHLEFQIVTPRTLAEFRGQTLILPDVRLLGDTERSLLRAQVSKGTRLVVTGMDATNLDASPTLKRFAECPGKAYLDELERDFEKSDPSTAKEFIAALAPDSTVRIEASSSIATQIARVDGMLHVFLANFKGLAPKKSAVQTPERGIRISVPAGETGKAWFLPFLGEARVVQGQPRGGDMIFVLPDVEKGAVVWFDGR